MPYSGNLLLTNLQLCRAEHSVKKACLVNGDFLSLDLNACSGWMNALWKPVEIKIILCCKLLLMCHNSGLMRRVSGKNVFIDASINSDVSQISGSFSERRSRFVTPVFIRLHRVWVCVITCTVDPRGEELMLLMPRQRNQEWNNILHYSVARCGCNGCAWTHFWKGTRTIGWSAIQWFPSTAPLLLTATSGDGRGKCRGGVCRRSGCVDQWHF